MKLSVILPCYNGAETIAVQLEALADQQWSGVWEMVVVNNGSTDNSMAIVESYRDRLPNLQIVEAYHPPSPRLGVPHSYNMGLKAATGDAFVFCESDDEVAPGWLAAMATALSEHNFVACRIDYQKLNEPWRLDSFRGAQTDGLCKLDFPPYLPFASGCSFGMHRKVVEIVGEMNVALPCSFEADYCWKAQYHGFQLHFVAEAVMHYRLRHTFEGIYRQGRNYGRDLIFLRKYYRNRMGRLDPLRMLGQIVSILPRGLWLLVLMQLGSTQAKSRFAMWFWFLGLKVGMLRGLLLKLPDMVEPAPLLSELTPISTSLQPS